MLDFFWGSDVGPARAFSRSAIKVLASILLAAVVVLLVKRAAFSVSSNELKVMEDEINTALILLADTATPAGDQKAIAPVHISLCSVTQGEEDSGIRYIVTKVPSSTNRALSNTADACGENKGLPGSDRGAASAESGTIQRGPQGTEAPPTEGSSQQDETAAGGEPSGTDEGAAPGGETSDEEAPQAAPSVEDTVGGLQGSFRETGEFYESRSPLIDHPRIKDSIHVMLRRIEKVWKSGGSGDLRLCAESRKSLSPDDCERIERVRLVLERETLSEHLQSVAFSALFLGWVQFVTLTVFFYALAELCGSYLRFVKAPNATEPYVDAGVLGKLDASQTQAFASALVAASNARYRGLVDRFLEKALAPSTTTAEIRLRNYRDMLIDDVWSRIDGIETLGDTMLKVAFLGTVTGIGASLFAARSLDAADPLIRLEAKAQMYAGIGMGFGATMVGIALSIILAKTRATLGRGWLDAVDSAWRRSAIFYDTQYHAAAPAGSPYIAGTNPLPSPYPVKLTLADKFFFALGVVSIVIVLLLVVQWVRNNLGVIG